MDESQSMELIARFQVAKEIYLYLDKEMPKTQKVGPYSHALIRVATLLTNDLWAQAKSYKPALAGLFEEEEVLNG